MIITNQSAGIPSLHIYFLLLVIVNLYHTSSNLDVTGSYVTRYCYLSKFQLISACSYMFST